MQINKVERFETFILLIDAVHKGINKIKTDILPDSTVKGVHTLWLYELLQNPEGLTATEIANKTMIDRSLVSREIRALMKEGIVESNTLEGKRSYNSVIVLTEKGRDYAEQIARAALEVQQSVSKDVSIDDLATFYSVLDSLYKNITKIADKSDTK